MKLFSCVFVTDQEDFFTSVSDSVQVGGKVGWVTSCLGLYPNQVTPTRSDPGEGGEEGRVID